MNFVVWVGVVSVLVWVRFGFDCGFPISILGFCFGLLIVVWLGVVLTTCCRLVFVCVLARFAIGVCQFGVWLAGWLVFTVGVICVLCFSCLVGNLVNSVG